MMATKPQRKPTAAEEAILSQFSTVESELPGGADVQRVRREAAGAFERDGLPTRKVEAWHYTDLRTALREVPARAEPAEPEAVAPLVDGAFVLSLDGLSGKGELPGDKGVFRPITEALDEAGGMSPVERRFDTIGQINTAFATSGIALHVDADEGPDLIELQAISARGQQHRRNLVTVGPQAHATIVERHVGGAEGTLASTVTSLRVEEGANATYVIVQDGHDRNFHLGQLNAEIGSDAKLTLILVQGGPKVSRHEINIEVAGENSDFQLRGVTLVGGETLIDTTMVVNHAVPNTTSEEVFRNVCTGRGRGVFQGQIKVAQPAQKTDAKMSCNTLLLSDDASFAAKPELEIFADDVACGHGATVDDLEPTQLFYLLARGIPEARARALLVKGFVDEMLEAVEDEKLAGALEAIIDEWLGANA